jgi:hypothetical protein
MYSKCADKNGLKFSAGTIGFEIRTKSFLRSILRISSVTRSSKNMIKVPVAAGWSAVPVRCVNSRAALK